MRKCSRECDVMWESSFLRRVDIVATVFTRHMKYAYHHFPFFFNSPTFSSAHPNLIKIINTIEKGDDVKGFTKETVGFFGHLASNVTRSLGLAVARPRSKANLLSYYEGQLSKLAANFGENQRRVVMLKCIAFPMVHISLDDVFTFLTLGFSSFFSLSLSFSKP